MQGTQGLIGQYKEFGFYFNCVGKPLWFSNGEWVGGRLFPLGSIYKCMRELREELL